VKLRTIIAAGLIGNTEAASMRSIYHTETSEDSRCDALRASLIA